MSYPVLLYGGRGGGGCDAFCVEIHHLIIHSAVVLPPKKNILNTDTSDEFYEEGQDYIEI